MSRLTVLIAVILCGCASMAQAQLRDERLTRQLLREFSPAQQRLSAGDLTAAEAARIAQSQYGGRVLSVDPAGNGFRVKLLIDGEVRIVHITER
jgi:hypothetical protein